jgi:hypothetical protein
VLVSCAVQSRISVSERSPAPPRPSPSPTRDQRKQQFAIAIDASTHSLKKAPLFHSHFFHSWKHTGAERELDQGRASAARSLERSGNP